MEMADLAIENDSTVLIFGETGAGKGVLGRWIHDNSSRGQAAFVEHGGPHQQATRVNRLVGRRLRRQVRYATTYQIPASKARLDKRRSRYVFLSATLGMY